ncbi:MAG: zinc ribbon domain-containing protein [Eubacterium sp.]|nr:zinc ribbon domain-containing protein [Candidatus Colimonas fimequi]
MEINGIYKKGVFMTESQREKRLFEVDTLKCPECGLDNDPIFAFCEECGARLTSPQGAEGPGKARRDERQEAAAKVSKKGKGSYVVLVILLLVIAAFASGRISPPWDGGASAEVDVMADAAEPEESQVVVVEEAPVHPADPSALAILSSDWDWDSARGGEGAYTVDVILYVANQGDEAIVAMDFIARDKAGDAVAADGDGAPLHGVGLVKPGEKGIMVAQVKSSTKGIKVDTSSYEITAATANSRAADYSCPQGAISGNHGDNNDFYDISVTNTNNVAVSADSKVVAVFIKKDKIVESDATGKLAAGIKAGEQYEQKDAFYDPNFYYYKEHPDKYKVFVIDEKYLCGNGDM